MKTVEVGSVVQVKNLGARGIVESVDDDGFCWLKVESFPGRLGLHPSELKEHDGRHSPSVAPGLQRPSASRPHYRRLFSSS